MIIVPTSTKFIHFGGCFMKPIIRNVNSKDNYTNEKLISYEYTGGIYPVLIAFFTPLVLIDIFLLIGSIAINSNPLLKLQYEWITQIPIAVTITIIVIFMIINIMVILLFSYLHYKNTNTFFEIFSDKIVGNALLNNSKTAIRFEFPISDIQSLSVSKSYFVIQANNNLYSVMLTTRDFKNNLRFFLNNIE